MCTLFESSPHEGGHPLAAFLNPAFLQQLASQFQTVSKSAQKGTDEDTFRVSVDVGDYQPEEVSVRVDGHSVIVEAKHEEKEDEGGLVSRHFVRRFVVPEGFDLEKVVPKMSLKGVLSVEIPKLENVEGGSRTIPVVYTGEGTSGTSGQHQSS